MTDISQNYLSQKDGSSREDPDLSSHGSTFPIVGVGASAGGLEALELLFASLPEEVGTKMAFIVVQHLPSDYRNMLGELLGRCTALPLVEASNGMAIAPGTVYVSPAGLDLTVSRRRLWCKEPDASTRLRFPIDTLFWSLANEQAERSAGIILSGMGSDGTQGLRAIKSEGGLAIVQSPDTAAFRSMPESAIATGSADFVLPPDEIPMQLASYVQNERKGRSLPLIPPSSSAGLSGILSWLHIKTGHDFSGYKQSTTLRRIEKRQALTKIGNLDSYLRFLQTSPVESEALLQEFMVGVTRFFRDQAAFDALREKVVLPILARKRSGDSLRVWVAGCASGEETYSLAILFSECMEEMNLQLKVQIFGTDIDSRAIKCCRLGRYPANIATDVTPERLERFFTMDKSSREYKVKKALREMVIFAEHNLARDPPFSRLDLISCRNLLIYLDGDLQKLVLGLFHYALVPDGFLFLGASETVGATECFSSVDQKWRLYRAKHVETPTLARRLPPYMSTNGQRSKRRAESDGSIGHILKAVLLRERTPACVVIDKRGEIVYIHGRTGKYLEPSSGAMSLSVCDMAREGLREDLAAAIHRAVLHGTEVHRQGLRVKGNGDTTVVNVTVSPFPEGHPDSENMLIILFEEVRSAQMEFRAVEAASAAAEVAATHETGADSQVEALERQLQARDEYLHSIIEELESANEELQSTIEEYHSTSEELETSREELQSVNEELMAMNAELQVKNSDLVRTSNDMNNMLSGTGMGIVFVDLGLNILRFTPNATRIVNLVPSDVGRPVGHITTNLSNYGGLTEDVQDVLETLTPKEVEVMTKGREWYRLRIIPYRTQENVIAGAVIAFVSVTEIKRLQSLSRLALIVRDSYDAITVQSLSGHILAWNPGAERLYGWTEAEALTMHARDLVPADRSDETLQMIRNLAEGEKLEPFLTERLTKDRGNIRVWMTATIMLDENAVPYAIATTERLDRSSLAEGSVK